VGENSALMVILLAVVSAAALVVYAVFLAQDLRSERPYMVEFVTPFRYDASGDDERNLNGEYVTLQNNGENAVDMSGWTLRNDLRVTYTFPEGFVLASGATVTLYTGCGEDTADELYWCSEREIWDNDRGAATVLTPDGTKVAAHYYERLCETCGDKAQTP